MSYNKGQKECILCNVQVCELFGWLRSRHSAEKEKTRRGISFRHELNKRGCFHWKVSQTLTWIPCVAFKLLGVDFKCTHSRGVESITHRWRTRSKECSLGVPSWKQTVRKGKNMKPKPSFHLCSFIDQIAAKSRWEQNHLPLDRTAKCHRWEVGGERDV